MGGLGVHPAERLSLMGRRLIAHLAVRGAPQFRGLVCAELWPDVPEERARANLRRTLWQLPAGWVLTDGPDLVLDADVDLAHARRLANRAAKGERLTWDDVAVLSRDLLPGWYEEWLVAEQDRFRLLRVQALEAACHAAAAAGDHAVATQAGLAALAADPLRESAVTALVEALLAEGNRVEAVRRYRSYAQLLTDELGVAPGPALTQLIAALAHSA